ncbi:MAG: PepSY domain-containing protein [Dokdonella sp.]
MNTRLISIPLAALLGSLFCAMAVNAAETQQQLQAEAKITESAARATALTRVPHATVQSSELERENGKLIWSYDLQTPATKNITEVAVDAITGQIVNVDVETPQAQAKEMAADRISGETGKH